MKGTSKVGNEVIVLLPSTAVRGFLISSEIAECDELSRPPPRPPPIHTL